MKLDYALLNEPTALLQRLADAEEKLESVRTLPDELLSMTLTYDSETDPVMEIEIAVDKITAAIMDK